MHNKVIFSSIFNNTLIFFPLFSFVVAPSLQAISLGQYFSSALAEKYHPEIALNLIPAFSVEKRTAMIAAYERKFGVGVYQRDISKVAKCQISETSALTPPSRSLVPFLRELYKGNKSAAESLIGTLPADQQKAASEYYENKFGELPSSIALQKKGLGLDKFFSSALEEKDHPEIAWHLVFAFPDEKRSLAIKKYEEVFGQGAYQRFGPQHIAPRATAQPGESQHDLMSSQVMKVLEDLCDNCGETQNQG